MKKGRLVYKVHYVLHSYSYVLHKHVTDDCSIMTTPRK